MKAVESEVSYAAYVGLDVHKETIAVKDGADVALKFDGRTLSVNSVVTGA